MKTTQLPDKNRVMRALAECDLFRFFPMEEIEKIAVISSEKEYQAGDLICARGTGGDEFYIVLQGEAEITVQTLAGQPSQAGSRQADERWLRTVGRAEYFGEIACLVENGLRTANVRARTKCRVLVIPRKEFLHLAQTHLPAAMALVRQLATRVRFHADFAASLLSPDSIEAATTPNGSSRGQIDRAWQWFTEKSLAISTTVTCFLAHLAIWSYWILQDWDTFKKRFWDIDGLTMLVSLEAIVLSIFILIAQKRAEEKEKSRRDLEFQWASATIERINEVNARLANLEQHTGAQPPPHSSKLGRMAH